MTTRWCCRILQSELGPMDLVELRDLASSGTLGLGDLVRRETDDVWMSASKCPELRQAFGPLKPIADSSAKQSTLSARASNETTPVTRSHVIEHPVETGRKLEEPTAVHRTALQTARQRWIAGSATAVLLLLLWALDHWIATTPATFPQPRQVREQLAGQSWFFGTGPWLGWEYGLLWLDTLVVVTCLSSWLTRRMTR